MIIFVSTEGLPGPLMINKFGKPEDNKSAQTLDTMTNQHVDKKFNQLLPKADEKFAEQIDNNYVEQVEDKSAMPMEAKSNKPGPRMDTKCDQQGDNKLFPKSNTKQGQPMDNIILHNGDNGGASVQAPVGTYQFLVIPLTPVMFYVPMYSPLPHSNKFYNFMPCLETSPPLQNFHPIQNLQETYSHAVD